MTAHAQTTRILTALAAGLDPILAVGRTARITLTISSGGNVRSKVATFQDVPADLNAEAQRRRGAVREPAAHLCAKAATGVRRTGQNLLLDEHPR